MADAVIPANKIVSVFAVITAETAIWTPAAGKRFRLLGFNFSSATAAGPVTFRDGLGGPTFMFVPNQALATPVASQPLGNGYLSLTANNVLSAQGASTQIITGYVFGTEE